MSATPVCILAVEDTPNDLELMRYLLEAHGHRVVSATNAADAIALAGTVRPDAIILDIQLPDANGLDLLELLRTEHGLARVPAITVTARAMDYDRDHAVAAGVDDYLTKPIDPNTFVASVTSHLPERGRA